jgi:hypothetical protein
MFIVGLIGKVTFQEGFVAHEGIFWWKIFLSRRSFMANILGQNSGCVLGRVRNPECAAQSYLKELRGTARFCGC